MKYTLQDLVSRSLPQAATLGWRLEQLCDGRRQCVRVVLWHDDARVPCGHDGPDATGAGRDDWRSRRQRLHDHVRKTVDVTCRVTHRGYDCDVGGRKVSGDFGLSDGAHEPDAVADAEPRSVGPQLSREVAVAG